jgi:hypothetical protein
MLQKNILPNLQDQRVSQETNMKQRQDLQVVSQKMEVFVVTDMRTSNPKKESAYLNTP